MGWFTELLGQLDRSGVENRWPNGGASAERGPAMPGTTTEFGSPDGDQGRSGSGDGSDFGDGDEESDFSDFRLWPWLIWRHKKEAFHGDFMMIWGWCLGLLTQMEEQMAFPMFCGINGPLEFSVEVISLVKLLCDGGYWHGGLFSRVSTYQFTWRSFEKFQKERWNQLIKDDQEFQR